MKLPKQLILLGEIFTIKEEKIDDDSVAEIDYEEKTIVFDLEQLKETNQPLEAVLWHELAHYFMRYYDLPNEEVLVEALAKFIVNIKKQLEYKKCPK